MTHLTDEQFAEWMAGEATSEALRHVAGCEQCAAETAALSGAVRRYSLAAKQQAEESRQQRMRRTLHPRRSLAFLRLRWMAAASLALALAGTTAYVAVPMHRAQPVAVQPVKAEPALPSMTDDELLEAVNNDLSRDVPQALAPVGTITESRNKVAASPHSGSRSSRTNRP